jgi:hypothetical protein
MRKFQELTVKQRTYEPGRVTHDVFVDGTLIVSAVGLAILPSVLEAILVNGSMDPVPVSGTLIPESQAPKRMAVVAESELPRNPYRTILKGVEVIYPGDDTPQVPYTEDGVEAQVKAIVGAILQKDKPTAEVKTCDICHKPCKQQYIDGKTHRGPWANMCPTCYTYHGVGLGVGRGQRYELTASGGWAKTAG